MKKSAAFVILFFFSLALTSGEEATYTNYSFARLSYVTGKTFIQRAADLGHEEGIVNMPISEGDRLTTTEGRVEIYLGKRNYLRLDHNTKIDFLNLPKRNYDLTRIRVWSGNIYSVVNFLEKEKNIEIHTSDVSIYILEKGLYRLDVRENSETEIFVFQGLIEAAGEEGSVLIKNEQRLKLANGHFTSRPTNFYAVAEDNFDQWSESRDSQLSKRVTRRYLPDELEDSEYELATYGDWTYIRPYGNVWVPRGLNTGWRPYYHGRWLWLPLCGWTWLPYEPWGWTTFHYGRWHWNVGLGWYWIPTSIWGPAWVSWYWGYDYFFWSPLSYYGYPVVIINDVFYGRYYGRYYPYNSRALTVIHKNQLQAKKISAVALNQESVKKLGKISLSNKKLNLKPVSNKVSIEKLGDKKFLLKKNYKPSEIVERSLGKSSIRKPSSLNSKRIEDKGLYPSKLSKSQNDVKSSARGYIKGGSYGYPSSPKISYKTSKSSSFINRVYKYISGSSGSNYIRGSTSRSSSKGTSSRKISSGSSSKSSSSVSRRSSSSSSRSSSSRSGSSKSGKVKKK